MWDFAEMYDIIKKIKEVIHIMLELFLLVVEKLIDDPVPLLIIIGLFFLITIFLSKRMELVTGRVYPEKALSKMIKEQLHKFAMMFPIISMFTDMMVRCSDQIYKDGKPQETSFVVYYIPMLVFVFFLRLGKVYRYRKESSLKCVLYLLPGLSIHITFLIALMCADRGILLLALLVASGIVLPALLTFGILMAVSPKDVKMIKIKDRAGNIYDIRRKDFITNKDEASIRQRDQDGNIISTIIIKKDDIETKNMYVVQPEVDFKKYTASKGFMWW